MSAATPADTESSRLQRFWLELHSTSVTGAVDLGAFAGTQRDEDGPVTPAHVSYVFG